MTDPSQIAQTSSQLPSLAGSGTQIASTQQSQMSIQQSTVAGTAASATQSTKMEEAKSGASGLLDDGLNSPNQDKLAAERDRQRQREQERRRREAVRRTVGC